MLPGGSPYRRGCPEAKGGAGEWGATEGARQGGTWEGGGEVDINQYTVLHDRHKWFEFDFNPDVDGRVSS